MLSTKLCFIFTLSNKKQLLFSNFSIFWLYFSKSYLDLLWGQLRFPISVSSCLQCVQLSELVRFLLSNLSMVFYIFHRHRVCLVHHVDLICSSYSWWEGFGSSSLATLLLGFKCGFISTSACGSSTGVSSEAALEDLGLPLWGPAVEVVQLLGSQGFWQHQALSGVGS